MFLSTLLSLALSSAVQVHNPQIPVIVDRPCNVLSEITITCHSPATLVDGTLEVELDGIDRKAVKSVRLLYMGTASPLISRTQSNIFKAHFNKWAGGWMDWCDGAYAKELSRVKPPKSGNVLLPFSTPLVSDRNIFYLSLEIDSRRVDLSSTFKCRVVSLTVQGPDGKEKLSLKEDGPVLRRMALSLRTHGDDGVDSYRIPGIVRTPKGTLLAVYDIRRDDSYDLNGDIDIGVSRSTDGGKTWEKMRVALDMGEAGGLPEGQNGVGDPCILVDESTGEVFIAGIWAHGRYGGTAIFTSRTGTDPIDVAQMVLTKSSDDGKTWSKPVNITSQVKDPSWSTAFQGPGNGICMKDGTLVFPFQWWDKDKVPTSGIIYSKDHGVSWQRSEGARSNVCEDQVVETEDGVLMLNMRNHATSDRFRKVSVTSDMGKTWSVHSSDSTLVEPVCQASLVKVEAKDNSTGKDLLLFCNPASSKSRDRMTLRLSDDMGKTWKRSILLDEESGWGYSCICPIDKDHVGVLYEGSTAQLVFQTVRIDDLMDAYGTGPSPKPSIPHRPVPR